jgi:hypothetical protein
MSDGGSGDTGPTQKRRYPRSTFLCIHGTEDSYRCRDCFDMGVTETAFCKHRKVRRNCNECNPSRACSHGKYKYHCVICSVSCPHDTRTWACEVCKGIGIPTVNSQLSLDSPMVNSQLSLDSPMVNSQLSLDSQSTIDHATGDVQQPPPKKEKSTKSCIHGKSSAYDCYQCWKEGTRPSRYCKHGTKKAYCVPCKGSGICIHGRRKNTCRECEYAPKATQPKTTNGEGGATEAPEPDQDIQSDWEGFELSQTCIQCDKDLDISHFELSPDGKYSPYCNDCSREIQHRPTTLCAGGCQRHIFHSDPQASLYCHVCSVARDIGEGAGGN